MSGLDVRVLRILLRFFRSGGHVTVETDQLQLKDDLEYLRIQWAMSRQVEDLVRHLLENRHEAQATLETIPREAAGYIRGRLNPVETIKRQRITGNRALASFLEPRRDFSTGPNHVLGWVLRYSEHTLRRYKQLLSGAEGYNDRVGRILAQMESVLQIKGIGEAIANTSIRIRPAHNAVAQAGRSRRRLYRKAYLAHRLLVDIESGDKDAIQDVLSGSLLGPLEDWQKFELLMALRMSEALAIATGHDLELRPIAIGSSRPIAAFGPFDVYWQNRCPLAAVVAAEPSEQFVNEILQAYDVKAGWDRPDVVICHRAHGRVVTVGEAKYSTSLLTWSDGFRDAASQVVRYARLYGAHSPLRPLLVRSLIAVSNLPEAQRKMPTPDGVPTAVGLPELIEGKLDAWATRVLSSYGSA